MLRFEKQWDALERGSWYVKSANQRISSTMLEGEVHADTCVVGGGLAGLSAALELAKAGQKVVLLEARKIGWGASGRNGGQALAGFASEQGVYETQVGREAARQAFAISLEALSLMRERIEHYAIDCELQEGALSCAVGEKKVKPLAEWFETMRRDYDCDHLEWLDLGATRRAVASDRYHAAVRDRKGFHVHPLNYTLGLARAAQSAGVTIHEMSEVVQVIEHGPGGKLAIKTTQGTVLAEHAVLAGNCSLPGVVESPSPLAGKALGRRVMPVGTWIVATEPLEASLVERLIPGGECVCDTQFVLDYFRFSADRRMLFGGRVSYTQRPPRNLEADLRRCMARVFPELAQRKIEHSWGGYVDISMNRAPDFGRIGQRIYYLQGFSGHGLALTGVAGRLAAEAIRGQSERFDLMARIRHHPFPGGDWFRTPALVLGTTWYRLRDLL